MHMTHTRKLDTLVTNICNSYSIQAVMSNAYKLYPYVQSSCSHVKHVDETNN